jgi:hypothetical protein
VPGLKLDDFVPACDWGGEMLDSLIDVAYGRGTKQGDKPCMRFSL